MGILKFLNLKNINNKLISWSIFASKVLVVWYLFNLLFPIYYYLISSTGRASLNQADQSTLSGILVNILSNVVLNGVQALVFYGYSQIANWILKLKNGDSTDKSKDEKKDVIEKSTKSKDKKKN